MLTLALVAGRDTTSTLGQVERDLTGDGNREVLRLVGTGRTIDSLDVVLSIESRGATIYRMQLSPLTRRIGFDDDRRPRSRAEQREWLARFGGGFFREDKFRRPAEFVATWKTRAPQRLTEVPANIRDGGFKADSVRGRSIWREIQRSPVTIFEFSPGGDRIVAIAWSPEARRFYSLIECC